MQIYELHFNPKSKEEKVFDSFIYEPQSAYEKNLGSLYMAGEIKTSSPSNSRILKETAEAVKKKFYSASYKSHNKALTGALKAGNEFLDSELKRENSSWLGNFSFAVLSVKEKNLSFTLSGDIKTLLIRGKTITDIGKELNALEIEPYPLKVFFNFLTGKLIENDVLLILTKDIHDFFESHDILKKIAKTEGLNEEKIRTMLPADFFKSDESGASGICILAIMTERGENPYLNMAKKAKEMIFLEKKENFLSKLFKMFARKKKEKEIKKNVKSYSFDFLKKSDLNRTAILLTAFIIVLFAGFLIFRNTKQSVITSEEVKLSDFRQKLSVAESLIISGETKKANELLKEILSELKISESSGDIIEKDAEDLKNLLESKLFALNKQKKLDNPEIFAEINQKEAGFFPQNITYSGNFLYFSSPLSNNLYLINLINKEKKNESIEKPISLMDGLSQIPIIFSPPSTVLSISKEKFELKAPNSDFSFDSISSYLMNIYFLDKTKGKIIKYPYVSKFKWADPQEALSLEEKTKSMALDGFIWILKDDDSISGYYRGKEEKTIKLDIYPEIKNFTEIRTKTEIPYIYISEPFNNRIIIIDKSGNLIKQFYSEKFNNIKDFTLSNDGKTIWILNDEQVYQIQW